MELSEEMKEKLKHLGLAISSALSESAQIAEAVAVIKEHGYELFLVLEATIGLSRIQGEVTSIALPEASSSSETQEFKMNITASDQEFLKALRIRLEEASPKEAPGSPSE